MSFAPLGRPVAALASIVLGLAACGGPAETATPTAGPATVAPATQAPATSPAPTLALPSIGPGFSLPSVDKELEDLLPDEIAGETVVKSSVTGEALVAGPGGDDYQKVLGALGKSPSDLTAGIGGTSKAIVLAFRIQGIDASTFFDAFVDVAAEEGQLTDVTIAGKQAKAFTDTSGTTLYLYFAGDAIITVAPLVADDALVTEIFQKLP